MQKAFSKSQVNDEGNLPSTILASRIFCYDDVSHIRGSLDKYDWQLNWLHELGNNIADVNVNLNRIRSSLARISVVRSPSGRFIVWDERYFDHYLNFLMLLGIRDIEKAFWMHQFQLFASSAEKIIIQDPHRALLLQHLASMARRDRPQTGEILEESTHSALSNIFRMTRNFCLLHEIGHLVTDNPSDKCIELDNLRKIREIFVSPAFSAVNIFLSSKKPEEHAAELAKYAARPAVEKELCADIFAIRMLVDSEFGFINKARKQYPQSHVYTICVIAYYAINLFHYYSSDRLLIQEKFVNAPTIVNPSEQESERSAMNVTRGDMRMFLLQMYVLQKWDYDPDHIAKYVAAYGKITDFPAKYRAILLPALAPIVRLSGTQFEENLEKMRSKYTRHEARQRATAQLGWRTER